MFSSNTIEITGKQFNENYASKWNYCKLTNKSCHHRGVFYKEGLIEDHKDFNGVYCNEGGIHFCKEEDIHYWLNYNNEHIGPMYYIWDVVIPDNARVVIFQHKAKSNRFLLLNKRSVYDSEYLLNKLLKESKLNIKNIPLSAHTPFIRQRLLKESPYNIQYLNHLDDDTIEYIVKNAEKFIKYYVEGDFSTNDSSIFEKVINGDYRLVSIFTINTIETHMTKELAIMIMTKDLSLIFYCYIPDSIRKNKHVMNEVFKINPYIIREFPRKMKRDRFSQAIKMAPDTIKFVNGFVSHKVYSQLAKLATVKSGSTLQYLPKGMKRRYYRLAIQNDPSAIQYLDETNDKYYLEAVKINPKCYEYLPRTNWNIRASYIRKNYRYYLGIISLLIVVMMFAMIIIKSFL